MLLLVIGLVPPTLFSGLKFYAFLCGFFVNYNEYIVWGWKAKFVTAGFGWGFMEGIWL